MHVNFTSKGLHELLLITRIDHLKVIIIRVIRNN